MESLRDKIAQAILSRDVKALTEIVLSLEDADSCDIKILREEARGFLGLFLAESDRSLGLKYLKEAIEKIRECSDLLAYREAIRRIYSAGLLIYPEIKEEALKDLSSEDPEEAPIVALALAFSGKEKEAQEIIEKYASAPKTPSIALLLLRIIPIEKRNVKALVEIARNAYRHQDSKRFYREYKSLLEYLYEQKLYGDEKAKVYALLAIDSKDKNLAMQAFKSSKDEFVRQFSSVILADLFLSENTAMAIKYASNVKPCEECNGREAYVNALASYIIAMEEPQRIFDAIGYSIQAFYASIEEKSLSPLLVEEVYARSLRVLAFMIYKLESLKSHRMASLLESVCEMAKAFVEYRRIAMKACACAYKSLGLEYEEFLRASEGFPDELLDECLS